MYHNNPPESYDTIQLREAIALALDIFRNPIPFKQVQLPRGLTYERVHSPRKES